MPARFFIWRRRSADFFSLGAPSGPGTLVGGFSVAGNVPVRVAPPFQKPRGILLKQVSDVARTLVCSVGTLADVLVSAARDVPGRDRPLSYREGSAFWNVAQLDHHQTGFASAQHRCRESMCAEMFRSARECRGRVLVFARAPINRYVTIVGGK